MGGDEDGRPAPGLDNWQCPSRGGEWSMRRAGLGPAEGRCQGASWRVVLWAVGGRSGIQAGPGWRWGFGSCQGLSDKVGVEENEGMCVQEKEGKLLRLEDL